MSRIVNTLRLLDILSSRQNVSVSELASILEVSERTVLRMRDDLLDIGYNVESKYGPGGGLSLQKSSFIPALEFTQEEQKHISQGFKYLLSLDMETFGADFYLAIAKIHHQFDQTKKYRSIETISSQKLNIDGDLYQKNLLEIESAITQHIRIKIEYKKNHREVRRYIFEPYEMILVNQIWYVVGYEKGGRQLTLRVTRILEVELTDTNFRVDEYFSKSHTLNDFGFKVEPVKIKVLVTNFDSLSEYIWGDNQEIVWLNDYQFELSIDFPNILSAKEFILKGGKHLKVLAPIFLKEWIEEEAQAILDIYR